MVWNYPINFNLIELQFKFTSFNRNSMRYTISSLTIYIICFDYNVVIPFFYISAVFLAL